MLRKQNKEMNLRPRETVEWQNFQRGRGGRLGRGENFKLTNGGGFDYVYNNWRGVEEMVEPGRPASLANGKPRSGRRMYKWGGGEKTQKLVIACAEVLAETMSYGTQLECFAAS